MFRAGLQDHLCIQSNWYMSCVMLTGCWHDYTGCSLYRVDPPDDEQQAYSKHAEAYYWNKLIENSAICWFILYYTDQNSVLSPAIHIISNSLFTKQQGIRRKYQVMQQNNCPSASIKHIYVTSTRTYPMCYQWQKLLIEEKNQVWQKWRGNEEEETVWWP